MIAPAGTPILDSRRLWSLWDIMQRFRAASVASAIGHLQMAAAMIQMADYTGLGPDAAADREHITSAVNQAALPFSEVPLSFAVKHQFGRLQSA
jgi:hypothetical protein